MVNHALPKDVTSNYVRFSEDRLRDPVQRVCDKLKSLCAIEGPPLGVTKLAR